LEEISPYVAVVSEPFAVAYGTGKEALNAIVTDIGAGTVDYCHFCGAFPRQDEQSTIAVGGDHVDSDLRNAILNDFPEVKMTLEMARHIKEKYGDVGSRHRRVVLSLPTRDAFSKEYDITAHVRGACTRFASLIAEGLVEQIKAIDTDEFLRFGGKVLLAGGGSQLSGLDEYLETAVKPPKPLQVTRIHDWRYAGAQGALALAQLLDEEGWKMLTQETSMGLKDAA
jgi:rod shape-determining protein MreB